MKSITRVKIVQYLLVMCVLLIPLRVNCQSFCLSDPVINKGVVHSNTGISGRREQCKMYWINVYIHRVLGYIEEGDWNGWEGYNSTIDTEIMTNLNSSFNKYGFYFELIGSRDWFTNDYANPNVERMALIGIFDDPYSQPHSNAINIYLLPSNSSIKGGFVPSNDRKNMVIGGTQVVEHCSGDIIAYEVATTRVISHEMGHCLGLPHTFDVGLGTTPDFVTRKECVDPNTCQFVYNCADCNVGTNPTTNLINFMSYTTPNCMSEFSQEQVSVMRADLEGKMASIVAKTKGFPSEITSELIGPSDVIIGSMVQFEIPDQVTEDETYIWTMPSGYLRIHGGDSSSSVGVMIGSLAESGYMEVKKTNFCGDSEPKLKYVTVNPGKCADCGDVNVFPNPAFNEIYVSFSSLESGDKDYFSLPREYVIFDSRGRTVYRIKSRQTNLKLDLSRIKHNGVYILKISVGNFNSYRYRFVVAR